MEVYLITYEDLDDETRPVFTWRCYAYDRWHALDQMEGIDESPDWRILSVERSVAQ